jgi:hypothetical protein
MCGVYAVLAASMLTLFSRREYRIAVLFLQGLIEQTCWGAMGSPHLPVIVPLALESICSLLILFCLVAAREGHEKMV